MDIPIQYKREELRFCKIKKGTKRPFEEDWVHKPYTLNDIREWIESGNNYGILCGYGGLIVLDSDEPELRDYIDKNLPQTFRVRTGGGGYHDYYFCRDFNKRVVLQNSKHFGEIQAFGNCVIASGSTHPNGNKYYVERDSDIVNISKTELLTALKPFMKEINDSQIENIKKLKKDFGDADINNIDICKVVDISKFKFNGKEYQGENPWHSSSTGNNFCINPSLNIGYCFRCNEGINVAKAIALNNGLIKNCFDNLTKQDFLNVLDIAQREYGLKKIEKRAEEIKKYFFDKMAIAEEFIDKQPLHYDESGLWWVWSKKDVCWKLRDDIDILNLLYDATQYNTISTGSKAEILNALKQVGRKRKPKSLPKSFIQFSDKIVDINTGDVFDASSEYFITNPIPWKIGESIETPMMDKIFEEWVGVEKMDTLYEIIAYCLIPSYPIHRLFCLHGGGLNGKSCFLRLLKKFVGKYNCASSELDRIMDSRFEITKLYKKLVCMMGETNFSEISKTAILKQLTGEDLISFEYKNKTPFEDVNYAKILISTNNLPATSDKTIGFYRRWLIIDFPNTFNEQMDILEYIPEYEYNNLAKRSINLLRLLLKKRKFHNEGDINHRKKEFEERSNPFDKFWDENIKNDSSADDYVFKFDFKKKFDDWCEEHHFRRMSEKTIAQHMKEKGIEDGRTSAEWYAKDGTKPIYRCWYGIKWSDYSKKDDKNNQEGDEN
jgi:P4 family phage/plasmid primase-like protien